MKAHIKNSFLLGLLATFILQQFSLYAQGNAFTYQGRLNDSGQAANGLYDMKFILFDVPEYGFPVGQLVTNAALPVSAGFFTTELDFGQDIFTGEGRWLEIAVRTNGGGAFVTLIPRQKLTPAPYAILASNVSGTVAAANIDTTVARDTEIVPTMLASDGSGSGLDADLLDGLNSTAFAAAAHDHYGSSWSGAAAKGLSVQTDNTSTGGAGLYGKQGSGGGVSFGLAAGVWGDSSDGLGILGVSRRPEGAGAYAVNLATSGTGYGVFGRSYSTDGVGVVGQGASGGAAVRATGSGIIQSTADSYVFVPGNALIKNLSTDTTRWDIQANGAARIWRGATAGTKVVYFPVNLPAVLYGQPVTLESIRVYYRCQNGANNYITETDLYKQTDADSWLQVVTDTTDHKGNTAGSYTLATLTNNRLSATQGALGLFMYLTFANDTEYIQIGGIRVQLSHQ